MKSEKTLISVIVLLAIVSSTMGFAFAPFSGYLTVEFDKTTANVGDTITMTVTASNEGLDSWYPVEIYVPIPSGTQYVSHVVPDKTLQNYDPGSGIWNVNRMRHDERGHLKTLIITLKVLPEAAGEPITGTASFQTLMIEGTGEDLVASGQISPTRSQIIHISETTPVASFTPSPRTGNAPLTVYFTDTSSNKPTSWAWDFGDDHTDSSEQNPTHTYNNPGTYMVTLTASNSAGQSTKTILITVKDGTDPGTGGGTGGGNGNGTGLGNGSSSGLGSAAGLLNQQSGGGGGNGKAYEVFQDTPKSEIYYGLAIILIAAVIILGYLYGTKRKQ
ncbi:PKD domain-containing protein [Methanobacterium formicicum]|nr:PKD domain-containing protein [Methanobacterium formicicum]